MTTRAKRAEARTKNSIQISHMDGRELTTYPLSAAFPSTSEQSWMGDHVAGLEPALLYGK